MITVLDDLKAKIKDFKKHPTDECIFWTHAKTEFGHGHLVIDGATVMAHRLAYEIYYDTKPEGYVIHSCDNPGCVNPHHLEDGTPRQNMLDMLNRGRHLGKGMWKLSEDDVREIVKLLDKKMRHEDIANLYGVSRPMITNINAGRSWSHITGRSPTDRRPRTNTRSKLSESKVRQIIQLLAYGVKSRDIARQFDVSEVTISHIKNSHTWKHIPRPWRE